MANRQELQQALEEGCRVLVHGHVETLASPDTLPSDRNHGPDKDNPRPVTGYVVRDPDGRLTHDGMLLALSQGGSVLWQGRVIDDPTKLPTPADLARHDERKAAEERKRLIEQRAALDAELAKVKGAGWAAMKDGPDEEDLRRAVAEIERLRRENEQLKAMQPKGSISTGGGWRNATTETPAPEPEPAIVPEGVPSPPAQPLVAKEDDDKKSAKARK